MVAVQGPSVTHRWLYDNQLSCCKQCSSSSGSKTEEEHSYEPKPDAEKKIATPQ
jgi:hypothetical protein